MPLIHRLSAEAAARLALQTAQQVGLPVTMPQVQQGVVAIIQAWYEQLGVSLTVDESSPYFQAIQQQFPGRTQQTRTRQNIPAQNNGGHLAGPMPPTSPAMPYTGGPMYVPPSPSALPPPPPGHTGRAPAAPPPSGIITFPPHEVPIQAPVMLPAQPMPVVPALPPTIITE